MAQFVDALMHKLTITLFLLAGLLYFLGLNGATATTLVLGFIVESAAWISVLFIKTDSNNDPRY